MLDGRTTDNCGLGGSWTACRGEDSPVEGRLGSYVTWLSQVLRGSRRSKKPICHNLSLDPNSSLYKDTKYCLHSFNNTLSCVGIQLLRKFREDCLCFVKNFTSVQSSGNTHDPGQCCSQNFSLQGSISTSVCICSYLNSGDFPSDYFITFFGVNVPEHLYIKIHMILLPLVFFSFFFISELRNSLYSC